MNLYSIKKLYITKKDIAGERLWVELKKIVVGNFADAILNQIVDCNVHIHIGLPRNCNLNEFQRVFKIFESSNNLHQLPIPITMVAALLNSKDEVISLRPLLLF